MNTIKCVKKSLCDWQVTQNDKHVAWITRRSRLYYVRFAGQTTDFPYIKFADARRFVLDDITPHPVSGPDEFHSLRRLGG